jgi:hypothetical protein
MDWYAVFAAPFVFVLLSTSSVDSRSEDNSLKNKAFAKCRRNSD